jgi:hypothetical protein
MELVEVKIPRQLYEKIAERAGGRGVQAQDLIVKIIEQFLSSQEAPAQQSLEARVRALENRVARLEATVEGLVRGREAVAAGERRGHKRVISFSKDWAEAKNIDIEAYIDAKERLGYVCNETVEEVICIWKEDLKNVVERLNAEKAGLNDLERALKGEERKIARMAREAGLLWLDSKEKRWKALTV